MNIIWKKKLFYNLGDFKWDKYRVIFLNKSYLKISLNKNTLNKNTLNKK